METILFGEHNNTTPLLFVHGSYCAAWIWERHFLPHFAKAGYYGAAISLSGHGKDATTMDVDSFGISDFLKDIDKGCKLFDTQPLLVGHSLGGYLVQRYALVHTVPGMILMASPALSGLSSSSQHIMMHSPDLAMQLGLMMTCGTDCVDMDVLGKALLTSATPEDDRTFLVEHFQKESSRVTSESFFPCLRLPTDFPKTLIIGSKEDAFIPETDLQYSRMLWAADLHFIPHAPHGLMIDPCWTKAAGIIETWLQEYFKK